MVIAGFCLDCLYHSCHRSWNAGSSAKVCFFSPLAFLWRIHHWCYPGLRRVSHRWLLRSGHTSVNCSYFLFLQCRLTSWEFPFCVSPLLSEAPTPTPYTLAVNFLCDLNLYNCELLRTTLQFSFWNRLFMDVSLWKSLESGFCHSGCCVKSLYNACFWTHSSGWSSHIGTQFLCCLREWTLGYHTWPQTDAALSSMYPWKVEGLLTPFWLSSNQSGCQVFWQNPSLASLLHMGSQVFLLSEGKQRSSPSSEDL